MRAADIIIGEEYLMKEYIEPVRSVDTTRLIWDDYYYYKTQSSGFSGCWVVRVVKVVGRVPRHVVVEYERDKAIGEPLNVSWVRETVSKEVLFSRIVRKAEDGDKVSWGTGTTQETE